MDTTRMEIFKAGLNFLGGTFAIIVSDINRKRLEEKRGRKQKDKKKEIDLNRIQLRESEKLYGSVNLNIEETILRVQSHLEDVERWAEAVKFIDLEKKKSLGSVYVQLETFLIPAKRHISPRERQRTIQLEKAVLSDKEHCVILGQPGAGKSTSLKKVCEIIIGEKSEMGYTFPILLRLRDLGELKSTTPIMDHIYQILPLEFDFNDRRDTTFSIGAKEAKEEAVFSFLNYTKPILVLDGFDELKDSNAKAIVLKELREFSRKLKNSKLVLSCRTGEFNYELEYSNTYEIAPLNDTQIELFVNKWINDKEKAKDFLNKVSNSPFADTSIKPLSLAHLCVIYKRIGNVPDQPKTIYSKVVKLLIEEWDEQRSIIRKSAFGSFQSDQKLEFLSHLAFYLTTTFQASTFTLVQFKTAYQDICADHGLPSEKSSEVVKELESHTGLFIESGFEKYDFVHKSIQEYLTAEYLVKLPSPNTVREHFETLGAELAIAVSISSNSSLYYTELVLNYFLRMPLTNSFYSSFVSRIISEKPSFNQNKLVGASTLALLSKWINPEEKKFNKNQLYFFDEDLYSSFFGLSKSLGLKEQKTKISEYYDYNGDVFDGEFVELIRIKKPTVHKRLPSKVYLPIKFYMEFSEE